MKRPLIIIPVEIASRELLYKQVMCSLLSQRGFDCILGSKAQIRCSLAKLNNYIYLDKGYHKGVSDELYSLISSRDGVVLSLDEEGAVDFKDNSTLLNRYSLELFSQVHAVFFWGEVQHEIVGSGVNSECLVKVTGHPRFELLKPAYKKLYRGIVSSIKNRYGEFVLVNTNMGFGNNVRGDDFVVKNYGGRFKDIEKNISFDKDKMLSITTLIDDIRKGNPAIKVVVRPHPEEDLSYYIDCFKGDSGVIVNSDGSVVPWIYAARAVIHPDCTTAIESAFIGKVALSYLPKNYPELLVTHLPVKVSRAYTESSALIDELNDILQNEEQEVNDVDEALEGYFSFSMNALENLLDSIVDIAKKDDGVVGFDRLFSFQDRVKLILRSIKMKVLSTSSARLADSKLRDFNRKTVLRNQDVIEDVFDVHDFNVKYIGPQVVLYTPSK